MKCFTYKFRLFSLYLLAISLLPHYAFAQDINELKAALSYNFTKFTQWPEHTEKETSWQICYIGEQYRTSFQRLENKTLSDKPITFKKLNSLINVTDCHVVYISAENRKLLPRLFIALNQQAILTISDMPGFIDLGGMIEIIPVKSRLKFKVNLKQIKQSQLEISSQVLNLAIDVKR